MKIINKIMIGIAVLCLLLCGGVLAFALNPDMTGSLAQMLYGTENNAEAVTEGVTTSGNTENTDVDGNIRVTLPNGTPGEMNGYVNRSSRRNRKFRIRKHRTWRRYFLPEIWEQI